MGGGDPELSRPMQEVLAVLNMQVATNNGKYLTVLMKACEHLPESVVGEIRAEVKLLLDAKVDALVKRLIESCKQRPSGPTGAAAPENCTFEQLEGALRGSLQHAEALAAANQPIRDNASVHGELDMFCKAVLHVRVCVCGGGGRCTKRGVGGEIVGLWSCGCSCSCLRSRDQIVLIYGHGLVRAVG